MVPHFRSLSSFLQYCGSRGELAVVDRTVDPHLEICEIADRVMRQDGGGKAILFRSVKGSAFPVAVNILGSANRMAWALGDESLSQTQRRVEAVTELEPPSSLAQGWKFLKALAGLRHAPPRRVRRAPCQEVVEPSVDLSSLPVLTTWPEDAGPFITWPMVFSQSPSGKPNCGMYRMQVFDRTTTGMHWQRQKDGRRHLDEASRRIPVAVALGGPPALAWAATAPLPPDLYEMLLAGFLTRRRVPMVRCGVHGIQVPAEADFVLEGWVDPDDLRREGPFGDHTGYYSQAGMYPAFHVERITRRRDAIFPATVVGGPPKEDGFMGLATERVFLPLLRRLHGEISDMKLPPEGVFHNLALLSVKKRFPYHAHKSFHSVWGTGQMMFTKAVVAFDEGTDLSDPESLLDRLDRNWHARRDTVFATGPADTLDHAGEADFGGKIGLDATTRTSGEWTGERSGRDGKGPFRGEPPSGILRWRTADAKGRVLLVLIEKTTADRGREILRALQGSLGPDVLLAAVFDDDFALESPANAMVVGGANLDPARDVVVLDTLRPGLALGLDCTRKRPDEGYERGEWPGWIRQDPEVVRRVDGFWKEMGL
ncbi:MAG TPA: menaquinone biosynthesis decarboxylase [Fibrobacteria bacterium]|nr:menaquinone biosynthesis decarboxylase [Fibrobacteria bacterium]